ncbi:MAG: hypothetical protein LBR26_05375 [Prevotella sp.]|jgi:hypothetical protein|nr:hypothetical protein [Prevotella sp.]
MPDGSVANKFSGPPAGTEKRFPAGYKSSLYPCSGIAPSADTFNPVAAIRFRNNNNGALNNVGNAG